MMRYRNSVIILVLGLALFTGFPALAQSINSQGTNGAPISVSNVAVKVLPFVPGRKGYCVEPETVSIRCETSGSTAAPSTTPTTTVGFLFPAATVTCHVNTPSVAYASTSQYDRLDCISTGAATNVSTWEE